MYDRSEAKFAAGGKDPLAPERVEHAAAKAMNKVEYEVFVLEFYHTKQYVIKHDY